MDKDDRWELSQQTHKTLWANRDSDTSTIWKVPGDTQKRWVGYDPKTGEIVVFTDTNDGTFHSYVSSWKGPDGINARDKLKGVLVKHGVFNNEGKLNKKWVTDYWDRVKQAAIDAEKLLQQQENNQWQKSKWYEDHGGGF